MPNIMAASILSCVLYAKKASRGYGKLWPQLNHLALWDTMSSGSPPIWCEFLEAGAPTPEMLKIRLAGAEQRFKDARDASSRRWANALARSA